MEAEQLEKLDEVLLIRVSLPLGAFTIEISIKIFLLLDAKLI